MVYIYLQYIECLMLSYWITISIKKMFQYIQTSIPSKLFIICNIKEIKAKMCTKLKWIFYYQYLATNKLFPTITMLRMQRIMVRQMKLLRQKKNCFFQTYLNLSLGKLQFKNVIIFSYIWFYELLLYSILEL